MFDSSMTKESRIYNGIVFSISDVWKMDRCIQKKKLDHFTIPYKR